MIKLKRLYTWAAETSAVQVSGFLAFNLDAMHRKKSTHESSYEDAYQVRRIGEDWTQGEKARYFMQGP